MTDRVDCGYTAADACEAAGCCYNNDTVGVIWCFHHDQGNPVVGT